MEDCSIILGVSLVTCFSTFNPPRDAYITFLKIKLLLAVIKYTDKYLKRMLNYKPYIDVNQLSFFD